MSDSYPPEPWTTVRYGNEEYRHKDDVSVEHCADGTVIDSINRNTAERIVACVNFCRQFPTDFLAKHEAAFVAHNEWQTLGDIPLFTGIVAVMRKWNPE